MCYSSYAFLLYKVYIHKIHVVNLKVFIRITKENWISRYKTQILHLQVEMTFEMDYFLIKIACPMKTACLFYIQQKKEYFYSLTRK